MIEVNFMELVLIVFSIAALALGISILIVKYLEGDFSKNKPPEEGYNEHNLPKGCTLIQLGDKYMFKIKNKYASMDDYGYFLWSLPDHISRFGVTKDKQFAIKRGIETFEFFKALGKI
jgi:hypothetical protein